MKYLIDSHTWLWWLSNDPQLGRTASSVLGDRSTELYLSAVTGWELTIKVSIGKLTMTHSLDDILQVQRQRHRVHWLDIKPTHCHTLAPMPFHHRDPFDRMLVAQAISEGMALLSRDTQLDAYSIKRVWN